MLFDDINEFDFVWLTKGLGICSIQSANRYRMKCDLRPSGGLNYMLSYQLFMYCINTIIIKCFQIEVFWCMQNNLTGEV